jgi:hypothetical protein
VLLTAAFGSLLTGAGAAHAQGGPSDPICRNAFDNSFDVICTTPVESDGRSIRTIRWKKNDVPLTGREFDDIRNIRVSCQFGEIFVINLAIDYVDFPPTDGSSEQIVCPKPPEAPRFSSVQCSAYGTVTAPFRCDFYWSGGTDPEVVTVSRGWVITYPDQNYARVTGSCFPYQIISVTATVTDAAGRRASATASGFCPTGNY